MRVRAEDRDDVALAQAAGVQRGGDAVDVGGQLAVGDRVAAAGRRPAPARRGAPLPAARTKLGHRQVRGSRRRGSGLASATGVLLGAGVWRQSHTARGAGHRWAYRPVAVSAARAPTGCSGTAPSSSPVPASRTTASQTCVVRPACTLVATRVDPALARGAQVVALELDGGEPGGALGQQRPGGQPAGGVGQRRRRWPRAGSRWAPAARAGRRGGWSAGRARGCRRRCPSRPGQRARQQRVELVGGVEPGGGHAGNLAAPPCARPSGAAQPTAVSHRPTTLPSGSVT